MTAQLTTHASESNCSTAKLYATQVHELTKAGLSLALVRLLYCTYLQRLSRQLLLILARTGAHSGTLLFNRKAT